MEQKSVPRYYECNDRLGYGEYSSLSTVCHITADLVRILIGTDMVAANGYSANGLYRYGSDIAHLWLFR